jgi:two-component system sensor histidine kinase/response regulator
MLSSSPQWIHPSLTWRVFDQVGALLQQCADPEALVLTEAQVELAPEERLVLVVGAEFSALLCGRAVGTPRKGESSADACQVSLSFEPEAIADFLHQHNQASIQLAPNHPQRQTQFTNQLISLLMDNVTATPALEQQVEQERLMNEVTSLIRQSLDLSVILETAVQQVRQFLQVDRLIIYQFRIAPPVCRLDDTQADVPLNASFNGITYESRNREEIPSILNLIEEDSSVQMHGIARLNSSSAGWAIADCEVATNGTNGANGTAPFAQSMIARAELVTPIVVQGQIWGLLIAHQCFAPRQWQERELHLMHRIAEHLAIAIYQAQLYGELQAQKQTLEQQVTERTQELRDTLIASQSASRAKSEFLSTMSHELRSPLTTIIGMAATLLRYPTVSSKAQQMLPLDKQQDYLRTIQNRGEHLLALINDILELSQVESGKTMLQVREFSLAQMARRALSLLQERADAKQVQLSLDLDWRSNGLESGELRFQADPQRMQQILMNLLSNAVKFTPAGGQVTLQVAIHGNTAMLKVSDTGIGIPDSQRPLLFQKFQQLDASYRRNYEGTGLGLALTKQLVDLHGGKIQVESAVGVGSVFTVFLPSQPLAAIEHARSRQPDALSHPRIVLIEDDEPTAALVCDLLTAAGYQVVWMMESAIITTQVEMLHPLVMILDLSRPNLARDAMARQIRATLRTKILGLREQGQMNQTEVNVDDWLTKPLGQPEQLIDKVATLMRSVLVN